MAVVNSPEKTEITEVVYHGATTELPFPIYVDREDLNKYADSASIMFFLINEIIEEFKRRDDDPEMDYFVW